MVTGMRTQGGVNIAHMTVRPLHEWEAQEQDEQVMRAHLIRTRLTPVAVSFIEKFRRRHDADGGTSR